MIKRFIPKRKYLAVTGLAVFLPFGLKEPVSNSYQRKVVESLGDVYQTDLIKQYEQYDFNRR